MNEPMRWVSVEDRLPQHRQAVLVRRGRDNWIAQHLLSDGQTHAVWRWQACTFLRGRTAKEVAQVGVIRAQDQHGNNLRPYCWDQFGPGCLFGQVVTHWASISDPSVKENAAWPRQWFLNLLAYLLHLANSRPPTCHRKAFFEVKDSLLQRYAKRLEHDHVQEIKKECYGPRGLDYCPGTVGRWCDRCGGTGIWDHFFVRLAVYEWAGYRFHRPAERRCRPTAAPDILGYVQHRDRGRASGESRLWLYLLIGEWSLLWHELRSGCRASPGWWPMLRVQKVVFRLRMDVLPKRCIYCGWPSWPKMHPPQHRDCRRRRLACSRSVWMGAGDEDHDIPF